MTGLLCLDPDPVPFREPASGMLTVLQPQDRAGLSVPTSWKIRRLVIGLRAPESQTVGPSLLFPRLLASPQLHAAFSLAYKQPAGPVGESRISRATCCSPMQLALR